MDLVKLSRKAASAVHRRFHFSRRLSLDELSDIAFLSIIERPNYEDLSERELASRAYLYALRYAYRELNRPPGLNYGAEKSDASIDDLLRVEFERSSRLKKDYAIIDLILDVKSAVDKLSDRDQELLKAYFDQSMTYREIGEMLGISPQSVYCKMQNVLDVLRFTLRSYSHRR